MMQYYFNEHIVIYLVTAASKYEALTVAVPSGVGRKEYFETFQYREHFADN